MTTQAAQIEDAAYRASMYAAASAAFTQEPTAQQLQSLVEVAAGALAQGACARESEQELMSHLAGYAKADYEQLRTQVATEYAELFVGPRAPLAPLYESIYVGMPRRLNTEVTMAVRRFYEKCGFSAVHRNSIPNDHMGLELEFMARLATREAEALQAEDTDAADEARALQAQFLREHLAMWADDFAARIGQAWCADYYDAWARFVQCFVAEDLAVLA